MVFLSVFRPSAQVCSSRTRFSVGEAHKKDRPGTRRPVRRIRCRRSFGLPSVFRPSASAGHSPPGRAERGHFQPPSVFPASPPIRAQAGCAFPAHVCLLHLHAHNGLCSPSTGADVDPPCMRSGQGSPPVHSRRAFFLAEPTNVQRVVPATLPARLPAGASLGTKGSERPCLGFFHWLLAYPGRRRLKTDGTVFFSPHRVSFFASAHGHGHPFSFACPGSTLHGACRCRRRAFSPRRNTPVRRTVSASPAVCSALPSGLPGRSTGHRSRRK